MTDVYDPERAAAVRRALGRLLDLVARAVRLIADGVVDREGVPGLSKRLGYSRRQLERLLHAETGSSRSRFAWDRSCACAFAWTTGGCSRPS